VQTPVVALPPVPDLVGVVDRPAVEMTERLPEGFAERGEGVLDPDR
jgi:hypothetical protein